MKVVVAHHFYSSAVPSGENSSVRRDVAALRAGGVEVVELFRTSDELTLRALVEAGGGIRAREPGRLLRRLCRSADRPDVVHVHNVFPLLTTSVVRAAQAEGVPVVQTLHNYRRTCAAGTHLRGGGICHRCDPARVAWPALRHGCYRHSRLQTVPVVVNQRLDGEVWRRLDAHIALSDHMRDRLVGSGVPAGAVVVRPTTVPDPGPASPPGRHVLFVGRLSPEKGVLPLIEAWKRTRSSRDRVLEIVGDGPQAASVAEAARGVGSVALRGRVDAAGVAEAIRRCAVLVVPSTWYEGCPTVISEAFAHGRGVLVADNPNLHSVVGDAGWCAEPTPAGLASVIDGVLADEAALALHGRRARARYLDEMAPAEAHRRLLKAYEIAMSRRGRRA